MFGTYLFNRKQASCVALHPQPLLRCLKAGESQTKIRSRSGTSFIRLPFCHFASLRFLFLPLCLHPQISSRLNGDLSLCFIHPQPHLTCTLSSVWGNILTPHPKTSQLNHNQVYRKRALALQTQSPPHTSRGP